MKNVIILYKDENGNIICKEISKSGIEYIEDEEIENDFWGEEEFITLEDIEDLLDKEI